MEKLRKIMDKFTEIEYDLESVLQVLNSLEENYESQRESELALNIHFIKRMIEFILIELKPNITGIDMFLLEYKDDTSE